MIRCTSLSEGENGAEKLGNSRLYERTHLPGHLGSKLKMFFSIWLAVFVTTTLTVESSSKLFPRPNILLILADDQGFSDLGSYGSEIATPDLDRLASGSLRFTLFYNAARCCPTRAGLLPGLYPTRQVWVTCSRTGRELLPPIQAAS
jgi:hypothetical protein